MAFVNCLTAGTAIADGTTLNFADGRLPLVFQVAGAALTGGETIAIQAQNTAGTWLALGTLTATSPRLIVQPPGIFRASRTALLTTSSGAEYDTVPVS